MKICHITNYLPKYRKQGGGAEWACFNLASFLQNSGTENIIFSLKPTIWPEQEKFNFFSVPICEDIFGYKLSFLKRIFYFDIVSFFAVRKIFNKIKPDIAHLHNFDLFSLSVISAAKTFKIPLVFSVYDYWLFSVDRLLSRESGFFRKLIFNFFLKKIEYLG